MAKNRYGYVPRYPAPRGTEWVPITRRQAETQMRAAKAAADAPARVAAEAAQVVGAALAQDSPPPATQPTAAAPAAEGVPGYSLGGRMVPDPPRTGVPVMDGMAKACTDGLALAIDQRADAVKDFVVDQAEAAAEFVGNVAGGVAKGVNSAVVGFAHRLIGR